MLVADASRLCTIVVAFRNIFHETTYLRGGKGRKKKKKQKRKSKRKRNKILNYSLKVRFLIIINLKIGSSYL